MSFRTRRLTNVAALMGGTAASTLLGGETDGLAIDFTDASLTVRDTTTTSNTWGQIEGNAQEFWRSRSFTSYASPSPKITRDSDGYYTYRPHNLVRMSEEFRVADWTKDNTTLVAAATTAPDGTTTATRLYPTTSGNNRWCYQSAIAQNRERTDSIYAKAAGLSWLCLYKADGLGTGAAWFNLSTGAVGTVIANHSASITALSDDWYRVSVTHAGTGQYFIVGGVDGDNSIAATTSGTNGVYIWGAHVNTGPTATTYVKTAAHNLFTQSQTLDNAAWTAGEATVGANAAVAPDGTTTADSLTENVANAQHEVFRLSVTLLAAPYTWSVYAKANGRTWISFNAYDGSAHTTYFQLSGAGAVGTNADGNTSSITSVGNGWYRCAITRTAGATANGGVAYHLRQSDGGGDYEGDGASGVYLWGAQLELASSPGKYVTTTTAAVYSANYDLPREWDSSGACQGLLVEEARTNICLYARDLTNAAWTKSNTTAALTATGVDGGANRASTLTATAGNGTALQSITSGSATRLFSAFVKRRTGTGAIEITQDNGGTWTAVTGSINSSTWTRVELPAAAVTNPIVGFRIVTSGDAIDVDYCQSEIGAFVTSPIYTSSASVTRAIDSVNVATSVAPSVATALTAFAKIKPQVAATAVIVQIDDGTANEAHRLAVGATLTGTLLVVDGGVNVVNSIATANTGAVNTVAKAAASIAANDAAIVLDGGTAVTDTSLTMPTVHTMRLHQSATGSAIYTGHIAQIMILPRAMSEAELQAVTT